MFSKIMEEWKNVMQKRENSPVYSLLNSPDLSIAHYKGYLLETYHYTRKSPQTQAWAAMYFQSDKYKFLTNYLTHAIDEISHDNLALTDLKRLGEDRNTILNMDPLPITTAFMSIPFYLVTFKSPITYLGQLFMLEYMATSQGDTVLKALTKANVPEKAMLFLKEHAKVDEEHNKMMKSYIEDIVVTEEDFEHFMYGLNVSVDVFFKMLHESLLNGPKVFAKV